MFNIERVALSLSFNPWIFILAVIIALGYVFFVYKYTIPNIAYGKKIILVLLRGLALILLLFAVFEPILVVVKKNILQPVNLIFTDNSRSIKIDDGTNREEDVRKILSGLQNSGIKEQSKFYTFGIKPNLMSNDSIQRVNFSEGITNFSKIFSLLEKEEGNISSAVIISDGVITDGSNPVFAAEKLNFPLYTIGIGDTTRKKDIQVKNVLYNDFIYAETPTTIAAAISNEGYEGTNVQVSFYENEKLMEQQNTVLSEDGIRNLNFEYNPQKSGEKKLSVTVSNAEGEFTTANNKKVFYVNVRSNKIKVLLIAGAPSPDLSFIKNSLENDQNLKVSTLVQIGTGKFIEKTEPSRLLDSADIIYLIGFPSSSTSNDFLRQVKNQITERNKPFFFVLSSGVDYNRLQQLQGELPFLVKKSSPSYSEVQPNIQTAQNKHPLIQGNSENSTQNWNLLPPILYSGSDFQNKPEAEVIATIKVRNTPVNSPLILSRRLGSKRSLAILAKDIWRWKLQTAAKELDVFDSFILNSAKWLNSAEEQKRVKIRTSKKIYSPGEKVEFSAQVYDEAFNPVSDAELKVNIKQGEETTGIILNSLGSGLYEGSLESTRTGDYSFSGSAVRDGKKLGADNGSFNIGEVDMELIEPRMNYELLSVLANRTQGRFYTPDNYTDLINTLNQKLQQASKEKITTSELMLWSNEWLLIGIIILFGIEWLIRKNSGML